MSNVTNSPRETMAIPWAKPVLCGNEKVYLNDALESTWISGGAYVERFEKDFSRFINAPYGVTTSNGTTALQLALLALSLKQGDEVIVPGFTFAAPVNMALQSGAKVVYADINPLTWCLDPQSVKEKITPKTKAIIPVHIYGNVCAMSEMMDIAQKHNLRVVEDSAEAAFSKLNGQYAGTFGDIGCFSFQATKTISMGEGGFAVTADGDLYRKMCVIRDHGMQKDKRYWHIEIGFNFRLTNLQAALGCAQLEQVDYFICERKRVYQSYCKQLNGIEGITLQGFDADVEPVVWTFAAKIDPDYFKGGRDSLINALKERGVETRPGFYTFASMPLYKTSALTVSQDIADHVILLPFYPSLTEEEIVYVCDRIKEYRR